VVHVERPVRALEVAAVHEVIKSGLLLQEVSASGPSGFLLQRQVHALVATVLLGIGGLNALDADARAQPTFCNY